MACFVEPALLRSAVTLYLTGSPQESAVVRQVYGNDIQTWCVDELTDFSFVFSGHATFNVNLAAWNVSRALSMRHLFQGAAAFNQDLSSWDTRRVTTFQSTFEGATSFVGMGLEQWNVSGAVDMNRMFMNAPSLTANLAAWDTSRVATMQFMFDGATSFAGRGLEQWTVSNVTSMRGMFRGASHFDTNLCRWSTMLDGIVDTDLMLDGTQCQYPDARGNLAWNKTSFAWNSTTVPSSAFCQACFVTMPSTDNAQSNSTMIADQQQRHDRNRNDALTIIAALCCLIGVILSCWACSGRKDQRKATLANASTVRDAPTRHQGARSGKRMPSVGYKKEPLDDDDSQWETSSQEPVLRRPHHSDNDYYATTTTTATARPQPWSKSNVLDMSSDFGDFSVSSREQSND
jgi:surface protein